jgi:uncharacterized protein YcfL
VSSEVEDLRRRVAELEAQLEEQSRATNQLVARSQDKLYWYDRWGIDLDRVMQRRSAQLALETLKGVRGLVWAAKRAARKLRS